jgi:V-type H+-transporting ATPase subunit d
MSSLLALRADLATISITYNSLATDLGRTSGGKGGASGAGGRARLYPSFGNLYPNGAAVLSNAEDEDALRRSIGKAWPEYAPLWDAAPVDARGVKDISDAFFRASISALELAFEGQFHYASYYAYAKLKEQEVKNVAWIATCLEHGVYSEMDRIIPVFSKTAAAKQASR